MNETKSPPVIDEQALLRELRFGSLDKDHLKDLVGIVAGIQKRGVRKMKVYTKGIPVPDGIRISGILDGPELKSVLGDILVQTPHLAGVAVFPYGIPWPDIFKVNIDIGGGPVEQGAVARF